MKWLTYRTGFFAQLFLLLIFLLWIFLSLQKSVSPRTLLRGFSGREIKETVPVPTEFFEAQDWLEDIFPDEITAEGLNTAGGLITLRFPGDMDKDYLRVSSRSIMSLSSPLTVSGGEWVDNRTFRLQVNRPLEEGEYVRLTLEFMNAAGRILPQVRLNYE